MKLTRKEFVDLFKLSQDEERVYIRENKKYTIEKFENCFVYLKEYII